MGRVEKIGKRLVRILIRVILPYFIRLGKLLVKAGRALKRNKKKIILIFIVSVMGYILGTGLVMVPPHSVRVVRYPHEEAPMIYFEKPVAVMNNGNYSRLYFTWPRIPKTSIGAKEETYSLEEPIEIETEIAVLSFEDVNGELKQVYLKVEARVEVEDWDEFLLRFDPKLAETEKTREEMLKENIEERLTRFLAVYVRSNYKEFVIRSSLVWYLKEKEGLQTPQEIEDYLKAKKSWIWALGPLYFPKIVQEMANDPDVAGNYGIVGQACLRAYFAEINEENISWAMEFIEAQREDFFEEFSPEIVEVAQTNLEEFKQYLEDLDRNFPWFTRDELESFLSKKEIETEEINPVEVYATKILIQLEAKKEMIVFSEGINLSAQTQLRDVFERLPGYYDDANVSLWRAVLSQDIKAEEFLDFTEIVENYYLWLKEEGLKCFIEGEDDLSLSYILKTYEQWMGLKIDINLEFIEK